MKYVYVVTSIEMGWDCVCDVYEKSEDAYRSCFHDNPRGFSLEQMMSIVDNGDTVYVISAKKLK